MAAPSRTKVWIVACGSFNPITYMHLRLFELARDSLNQTERYEVVGGIVSPVNDAYGKKDLISGEHRINMCRLATKSSDWIRVDDWEVKQSEWTRTRFTLEHFDKTLYADQGESGTLKMVCGGDLLESFAVPNLWAAEDRDVITGQYGLVVITRAGSNPEKFVHESDALYKNKDQIHIVTDWCFNNCSSTEVRRALRRGNSARYLVPDEVLEYIQKNDLYKTTSSL